MSIVRIAAVRHALPSLRLTNDDVVGLVRAHNAALGSERLDAVEEAIRRFLASAGTVVRYFVDPGTGEKAIDLALDAGRRALAQGALAPENVDFVIYCGVGRGWVEPAMANVIQSELGLVNANVFDVLDACGSWLKALHIAHTFLSAGTYRAGLIVNCEAGFRHLADLSVQGVEDLEHKAAALTVGEAATATVVLASEPADEAYFRFRTEGRHHGLCMVPLASHADFEVQAPDPRKVPGKFFSLSSELIGTGVRMIIETYQADPVLRAGTYDLIFGHAASRRASELLLRRLRLPLDRYVGTHERFGNTVSASIPLGMSVAWDEERLRRGARVLIVVGSAGLSVGFATFRY